MSCPKCANNITFKLRELPGISNVRINMGTGLVKLKVDPGEPPREDILRAAITNSGFTFVRAQFGSSAPDSKDHQ
jgi:copper chaperone CopZ